MKMTQAEMQERVEKYSRRLGVRTVMSLNNHLARKSRAELAKLINTQVYASIFSKLGLAGIPLTADALLYFRRIAQARIQSALEDRLYPTMKQPDDTPMQSRMRSMLSFATITGASDQDKRNALDFFLALRDAPRENDDAAFVMECHTRFVNAFQDYADGLNERDRRVFDRLADREQAAPASTGPA